MAKKTTANSRPPERSAPLRVFLCHASCDRSRVEDLYIRLTNTKIDAWFAEEKLLPGQDWDREIRNALRSSDIVMVCLSEGSITKDGYVQKEIREALDMAKEKVPGTIFLIPVRLEPCAVPLELTTTQWVDLFEPKGYHRLLDALFARAVTLGISPEDVSRLPPPITRDELSRFLTDRIIDQPGVASIAPYIETFSLGLTAPERSVGTFLLTGPSGTGKTFTPHVLALALHGSSDKLLSIDCGEFGRDESYSRLVGSPPGYTGHGETKPLLSPERLDAATSDRCKLSIVLFDDVERGSSSLASIIRSILRYGRAGLGDGREVGFRSSLIFLTSAMPPIDLPKQFSEVRSNVDVIIHYESLSSRAFITLIERSFSELRNTMAARVELRLSDGARNWLCEQSKAGGGNKVSALFYNEIRIPLSAMLATGAVGRDKIVVVTLSNDRRRLVLSYESEA